MVKLRAKRMVKTYFYDHITMLLIVPQFVYKFPTFVISWMQNQIENPFCHLNDNLTKSGQQIH